MCCLKARTNTFFEFIIVAGVHCTARVLCPSHWCARAPELRSSPLAASMPASSSYLPSASTNARSSGACCGRYNTCGARDAGVSAALDELCKAGAARTGAVGAGNALCDARRPCLPTTARATGLLPSPAAAWVRSARVAARVAARCAHVVRRAPVEVCCAIEGLHAGPWARPLYNCLFYSLYLE